MNTSGFEKLNTALGIRTKNSFDRRSKMELLNWEDEKENPPELALKNLKTNFDRQACLYFSWNAKPKNQNLG